jgi:hypothetical protein
MPSDERASTSDPETSSDRPEQYQPQVDPDRPLDPLVDTEHVGRIGRLIRPAARRSTKTDLQSRAVWNPDEQGGH